MTRTGISVTFIGVLLALLIALASCGGGGTTTPANNNPPTPSQTTGGDTGGSGYNQTQDSGGGFVADPDGVMQYDGRTDNIPPITGGGKLPPSAVEETFGKSIVVLPQSSAGQGTILLKNFMPGQKVVMVTTNLDRDYMNFTQGSLSPGLPFVLPNTYYNFSADNLQKVTNALPTSDNDYGYEKFDVSKDIYDGIKFDPGVKLDPSELGKREVEYALAEGFLDSIMDKPRTISALSKGVLRTFTSVDATIQMPPIEDPEAQQEDADFQYPWIYQFQDGRLVGIGAHCYVFLSQEINNGYPDGVKFTPERIQRLVQEFDSKIFPTSQAAFGPVRTYNEETIYYAPDRSIRLSPDDFDEDGNLMGNFNAVPDSLIEKDQKIIIAILNGVAPGGGGFYISPTQRPTTEEEESPYATAPEINYDAFSTIYLDPSNFPPDSDDWSGAYSVIAHEFQHKLHSDNVVSTSLWFNESMSMLCMHVNGYSIEKGNTIGFFVSQLSSFMAEPNMHAMFNDVSSDQQQGVLYAPWYLFMLYVMEHYGPGTIRKFYTSSGDAISKLESATGEPARYIFQKWILANYIDGLNVAERNIGESDAAYIARVPLADPRFRYATFDMKGRIGDSTNVLPGVKVNRYPETEEFYPVRSNARLVKPWCSEYVLFENGTGGDLRILVNADSNYRTFILPINYNTVTSAINVDTSVYIP